MVNQAPLNGNRVIDDQRRKGLRRSLADLTNDVVALAELQWDLLLQDCASSTRRMLWPGLFALAGIVLTICAIPVALCGAAYLLVQAGMQLAWALLLVAAVAAGLGGLIAYASARAAARALDGFERSRSELRDNVAWLKQAVAAARDDGRRN